MEIRVLRYFLTVAREESITRAAQVLHNGSKAVPAGNEENCSYK